MLNTPRTLTVLALVCLSVTMPANPAHASTTVMTCVGENYVDFSPGLTYSEQTVNISGQDTATACTGLTNPELHSFIGPLPCWKPCSARRFHLRAGGASAIPRRPGAARKLGDAGGPAMPQMPCPG